MSKTIIKIHDEAWFKANCCHNDSSISTHRPLIPAAWKEFPRKENFISWLGTGSMNVLAGKVLDVTDIDDRPFAGFMPSAKYYADGFWIPNWAIEWVMEEQ